MVEAFRPFLLGCLLTGIVCFCPLETPAFSSGRQLIDLEIILFRIPFNLCSNVFRIAFIQGIH